MKSNILKVSAILIGIFLIISSCEETTEPDTEKPTVTITSPQNGSTVSEIVSITCMSSDNEGVEKVELWVNGVSTGVIDETEPYSLDWNTTTYDDSSYTIIVRSYDTSENTKDSYPITLVVDNSGSYPQSVSIISIIFESGSFTIAWNQSTDTDFDSYELEKSVESTMSDYEVVYSTENVADTTYVDSDVDPLSYQYYRITVIDTFGYETKGQIVSSSLDPVPTSVNVTSVTYTLTEMTVEWEESPDSDFRDYKILYSETESGDRDTLVTYTDKTNTSHIITDFDPTHENWFWVIVSDTLGQSSIGSGMSNTIDSPPTQVELYPIVYQNGSFYISWSQNDDDDFESYTLFESESEDMTGSNEIFSTQHSYTTDYIISDLNYGDWRFYQITVTDIWGLESNSLVVGQEAIITPPTNLMITNISNYEVQLTWDIHPYTPLSGYIIERQENNGDFIEMFTTEETSYNDNNLSQDNVYGYRIKAYSNSNISEPSEVKKIKWVVSSYSLLWTGTHNNDVFSASFSPNNERVATGDGDYGYQNSYLKVWDTETGGLIWEKLHIHGVEHIDYSQDNSKIAFTPNGCCGPIVFDAVSSEMIWQGTHYGGDISFSTDNSKITAGYLSVSFSPDNTMVVSGDSEVSVWDVYSGSLLWTYLAEDDEKKVRVLDSETGELLLTGNDLDQICSVAFSPDNTKVVSGGHSVIEVWDVNTGSLLWTATHSLGDCVHSVNFSPDGTKIVSGSGIVKVWDTETGNLLWTCTESFSRDRVSFSFDNTKVTSGRAVWDADSGTLLWSGGSGGSSATFSPDNTKILSFGQGTTVNELYIYQEGEYEWKVGEWY